MFVLCFLNKKQYFYLIFNKKTPMDTPKTINDSRLIDYLKTLTASEMNRFRKFVASPFFNNKKEAIALFKYLKKVHPIFEKDIYRRQIYNHLYPQDACAKSQPLDNKRYAELRRVMSRLTGLVQDFLLYESRNQNEVRSKQQLADILRNRGLTTHTQILIKKAKDTQTKLPQGSPMHLHDKYLIAKTELNHILSVGRLKDVNLQPTITNFHHHALAGQLRLYAAGLSAQKTMPKKYEYPMMKSILEHLAVNDYTHIPIIDVYYRFCMLFKGENNMMHYERICKVLEEKKDYFPLSELRHLYDLLLNFCNLKINKGLNYNHQKFDIYRRTFPDKIWNNGEYLSRDDFILAVRAALGIKDITGAKEIIDVYSKDLHPKQRKGITLLAYVFVYLGEKKYIEAENAMVTMRNAPPGFYYGLYDRLLATQIYYELITIKSSEYLKMFDNKVNNMDAYLRNARMSKRNKELYTNYLHVVRRIRNMRFIKIDAGVRHLGNIDRVNAPSPRRLENIKSDIKNPDKPLVSREWLLEKIEEVIA